MKILYCSAYYYPEKVAGINLCEDLLETMAACGNSVSFFAPTPCRGVSAAERKKHQTDLRNEKKYGSVFVRRISLYRESSNSILRALRYFILEFAFLWKAVLAKPDTIFAQSTPPIHGYIMALAKKITNSAFIYNLQDIFPDSLVNAGMTNKGSLFYKIGRKIENYTYKNADKIIVISESFKENIMDKGVPEEKIEVIPNWIDTNDVIPVSRQDNPLFDEYGLDRNKFIVLYAGNFGATQGAEVIIRAADILKKHSDIHFVLFGGGSEFEKARTEIKRKSLTNVTINPLLPPERISEVYSMGDVALITCKSGVGSAAIPSKTWSIMACNTPIIAAFDTESELADILRGSKTGVCVAPEDGESLAGAILKAKSGELSLRGGREYVTDHADRKVCLNRYSEIIKGFEPKRTAR